MLQLSCGSNACIQTLHMLRSIHCIGTTSKQHHSVQLVCRPIDKPSGLIESSSAMHSDSCKLLVSCQCSLVLVRMCMTHVRRTCRIPVVCDCVGVVQACFNFLSIGAVSMATVNCGGNGLYTTLTVMATHFVSHRSQFHSTQHALTNPALTVK